MKANKKEQLISKIFEKVMSDGTRGTRANEMYSSTDERLENKIYVVKMGVEIPVSGSTVKMVSVHSDAEDFSGATVRDMRIGCEEPHHKIWSNIYATEAPDEIIEAIAKTMHISD